MYRYIQAVYTQHSLSPLGRDLLPGLLEAVDGSALQPCQDRLQGVVVVELVALAGNLQVCVWVCVCVCVCACVRVCE